MREVVIVSGKRTPIGEYLGSLKELSAVELGIVALKAAIESSRIKASQIEEVVGGQVYQVGCKGNTGRQIALGAGCSIETVASTINQQCPSSLRAMEIVANNIILGKIEIGATVGVESMSNVPHFLPKVRNGNKLGNVELVDPLLHDGLVDAFNNVHMGVTAENLVEQYGITREEQDELSVLSHERAIKAIQEGKFKDEIAQVVIKTRKGIVQVEQDEHPRANVNIEALSNLKPAFKDGGTITAGNASSLNDGGAALILMEKEKAQELNIKPLARIISSASASVDPKIMGIGVVPAVEKALKFANLEKDQIDYWEINEAFAAQFLAVNRELELDMNKVNANGSGISLGHPIGATGARMVVTMINEMHRRGVRYGCASLCAGGGPAVAMVVEALY